MRYGFVKEAMIKYNEHSAKLVKLFSDVFRQVNYKTSNYKRIFVDMRGGHSKATRHSRQVWETPEDVNHTLSTKTGRFRVKD